MEEILKRYLALLGSDFDVDKNKNTISDKVWENISKKLYETKSSTNTSSNLYRRNIGEIFTTILNEMDDNNRFHKKGDAVISGKIRMDSMVDALLLNAIDCMKITTKGDKHDFDSLKSKCINIIKDATHILCIVKAQQKNG